jgi:KDO2-lipid IV(A) lauroyltransferase
MFKKLLNYSIYLGVKGLLYPIGILPISWIHALGRTLGYLLYSFHAPFRKRSFSNLSLATRLSLSPEKIRKITLESLQSMAITGLEYPKLKRIKNLKKLVTLHQDPETAKLLQKSHSVVFFCSHQANWELLFLSATYQKLDGIAIGKPLKNHFLYDWILSIRERFGGKIIEPKNAFKEGLRALKQGKFIGIVGDQSLPSSYYSSPFLGRKAYTSPLPALLSYRTGKPVVFAEIVRNKAHYDIYFHAPIFPETNAPQEKETTRIMNALLHQLEESIVRRPGEWLWAHNRWKQEEANQVYYRYRHESIAVVLDLKPHQSFLLELRRIYPKAFIDLVTPQLGDPLIHDGNIFYYEKTPLEVISAYKYKMIFNLSLFNLTSLRRKGSVFKILSEKDLIALASEQSHHVDPNNIQEVLIKAISRKNSYWKEEFSAP